MFSIGNILEVGAWQAFGILLGFAVVAVVEPVTTGGIVLLIAVAILVCNVLGAVFKYLRGSKE